MLLPILGNEEAIRLFLFIETILLILVAALVRFCCVFWKKKKLQNQNLGNFLEKRSSLRLQKKVFDRTISELEKKAAAEGSSTNEVLEQLNDLVRERDGIKRKLSTTYSLGRDATSPESKSLIPLSNTNNKSFSIKSLPKETVTVFHTINDVSSEDGNSNKEENNRESKGKEPMETESASDDGSDHELVVQEAQGVNRVDDVRRGGMGLRRRSLSLPRIGSSMYNGSNAIKHIRKQQQYSIPSKQDMVKLYDVDNHTLPYIPGLRDVRIGVQVHGSVVKSPYEGDVYMGSALIDSNTKCGNVGCVQKVIDEMSFRNVVMWNTLITCYEQNGPASEAVNVFKKMMEAGLNLTKCLMTWSSFKSCAGLRDVRIGVQVHGSVVKSPYEGGVYMGSALIDSYTKCGNVGCAQKVIDEMSFRNVVMWNTLITCYEQNGPASEAVNVFKKMMEAGLNLTKCLPILTSLNPAHDLNELLYEY
nr:protein gamete expressed 3 [Tanacetum cinerariifolium]